MKDTQIFASIANFEQAIGIGDIPDRKKTETIFRIMNETDSLLVKKRIYSFFDGVFDIQKSDKVEMNIVQITDESMYEEFFLPLIENEQVATTVEAIDE
jgi:hypothetical protein